MNDSANPAGAAEPKAGTRVPRWMGGVAVLLVVGLLWLWFDNRAEIADLRRELAGRLRETDTDSRDARAAARQAQESVRDAQVRIAQMESRLAESQSQQLALESLYQDLSRGRDEWVLAEVEQILAIASQQLQLAGNVQAALVALQTADARLARSERPPLIAVRKAMARDIERLKGTPNVDLAGLALRLDQVIAQVDAMPLAFEERAGAPGVPAGARGGEGYWNRLGMEIWGELKQLVRIRNVERPEPVLLAPSQAFFLRENLKLRLLNARLALLSRDQKVFREDLNLAVAWLQKYFDMRAKSSATASANLKQLAASEIGIDLPGIGLSLAAVRNYKLSREKVAR